MSDWISIVASSPDESVQGCRPSKVEAVAGRGALQDRWVRPGGRQRARRRVWTHPPRLVPARTAPAPTRRRLLLLRRASGGVSRVGTVPRPDALSLSASARGGGKASRSCQPCKRRWKQREPWPWPRPGAVAKLQQQSRLGVASLHRTATHAGRSMSTASLHLPHCTQPKGRRSSHYPPRPPASRPLYNPPRHHKRSAGPIPEAITHQRDHGGLGVAARLAVSQHRPAEYVPLSQHGVPEPNLQAYRYSVVPGDAGGSGLVDPKYDTSYPVNNSWVFGQPNPLHYWVLDI
jgi:hypothetical protein